jgi:hypothetical protein
MKLIREINDTVQTILEEAASDGNKKKNYYVEGIFLQSELRNRNGRWYPKSILEREVARYNKHYIAENRAVGELGHPDTPTINYDRASHKFLSLKEDQNNFIGRAKILDTPMGKIVKNLMDEDIKIGMSSRGMGSLKMVDMKEGAMQMVQDDYYLATAGDIVADPSAPDAFLRGIMESKEWVWDNGLIKEANVSQMHDEILRAKRRELEEVTLRNWSKFLKELTRA